MPVHTSSSSLLHPEYFRDRFSVDSFLLKLTEDVIDSREQRQGLNALGKPISNDAAAKATIDRVQKLIRRFIQAEYEVTSLGEEASAQLAELQQTADQDETAYKAEVRALELVSERIKEGIRDIDTRITHISQTATRVGDRLQTAEGLRLRCLEAQELIAHLHAFSCHSTGADFTKLPSLFNNNATLMEAAAVSRRLAVLAGEVVSAKQRTKLAPSHDPVLARTPGNTGGVGSVEHTLQVLESYCNWLENRVVSRFDSAVAEGDLKVQAQCVAIMTELDQEKNIAQRWVASRPMFLAFSPEMLDEWVRRANRPPATSSGGGGATAAAAAAAVNGVSDGSTQGVPGRQSSSGAVIHSRRQSRVSLADALDEEYDIVSRQARALDSLFRDLYTSVKEDISDVQEVFPEPQMVLEMFLQRLLEQNVQAALERLLLPSGMGMQALAAATAAATAAAEEADQDSSAGTPVSALGSFRERATSFAASFSSAAGAAAAAAAAATAGSPAPSAAAAAGGVRDAVVGPPGTVGHSAPSALLQQQQLRLLEQAYLKTRKLAVRLEQIVHAVAPVDVVSMAEGLWPAFLGNYPAQELNWLAAAYNEQAAQLDTPELDIDVCLEIMSWNAEAMQRALKLSAPEQAARNCRMLFHHLVPQTMSPAAAAAGEAAGAAGSGGDGAGESVYVSSGPAEPATTTVAAAVVPAAPAAHPGCLLEQLARHIIGGVEYSLELCSLSGNISNMFKMGFSGISKTSSSQLAGDFVNEKIRKALEAAHVATQIVGALQSQYSKVVCAAVSESPSELSAASSALLALIHAVEDSITMVLRKSVDTFMTHMERALSWEQRRSDFTPRDDVVNFAQPTSACVLGTALMTALREAVNNTLDGANKHAFLTEVCARLYQLLLSHMTRFTYSPTGALKWKKDVNEYAEVLGSFGVAGTADDMLHMQQLVNVLVVAPDSLIGLVNGSLRMTHREALRFISLREDFKTAKVDGKTLLELFSGDGLEGQLGHKG